jgi:VWFA-related protein
MRLPSKIAVLLLLVAVVCPMAARAEPAILWHSVPATAAAVARAQQKMLFVYYRSKCETCNAASDALMERAAADPVFIRAMDAFLPLRITDGAVAVPAFTAELSKKYKGPLMAVYDASGVQMLRDEKLTGGLDALVGTLLTVRTIRSSAAAASELRLTGNEAAADFVTGNAMLEIRQWVGAAERLQRAADESRAAGDAAGAQLAEVAVGTAWYGAGQIARGQTMVTKVLHDPVSKAVEAEAQLAYGSMLEAGRRDRPPVRPVIPPRTHNVRRLADDLAQQDLERLEQLRANTPQRPSARQLARAVEAYRKAYELAAAGSSTEQAAMRALAQLDDRPLPPKQRDSKVLRIIPPPRRTLTGASDFLAESDGEVARIDFFLDGKKAGSAGKRPFRATIDLGPTPIARTLKAVAFDAAGNATAEAALPINDRADAFVVTIVSPASEKLSGPADVELDVKVPPGRTLDRVDLFWNEEAVATLKSAPFRARLVAKSGELGYLRAAAVLDDGTTAEGTRLYNTGGVSESVEVAAVTVIASVLDSRGKRLAGLTAGDFEIEDEGVRVEPSLRSVEEDPVTIGVAVDSSSSMKRSQLYTIRAAAVLLGRVLRTQDEAFLAAFDTAPRLVHPRTHDAASLRSRVYDLVAAGGTSMFDGVTFALQQLQGIAGKKALVVFTDGREGLSTASAKECERLARSLGIPVYVIVPPGGERLGHALKHISEITGGVMAYATPPAELPALFDRWADEMRGQYVLSFTRPAGVTAGAWRTIRVAVPKREATVRTIQGYRAY